MPPLLLLHPQHRPWDGEYGAAADLDGDGVVGEVGERERDLVDRYVAAALEEGRRLGLDVRVLDPAADAHLPRDYAGMHALAAELARDLGYPRALYVAAHVNAGGGRDGLVGHDSRSGQGCKAALVVADALGALPELARVRTTAHVDDRHHRGPDGRWKTTEGKDAWLYRGWSCLQGIYRGPDCLAGVLCEPFFIDQVLHRPLTTEAGLRRVGVALASGAARYLLEAP